MCHLPFGNLPETTMSTPIVIPSVGESITSGVIASWHKKDGEYVERDEVVLDLETDKVTMEIRAPAAGVIHPAAAEGDQVDIGAVVGTIEEGAKAGAAPAVPAAPPVKAEAPAKAPPKQTPAAAPNGGAAEAAVRATPLARKLAEERGIDLSRITGTGAGNRIREQDVLAYAQSGGGGAAVAAPQPPPRAVPDAAPAAQGDGRAVARERMSPLRQRIAQRLVEAQQTAAMLTTFNECDMSAVMALRKQYKDDFEKRHGVSLGFMSFFVKACINALQAFPVVNASITKDDSGHPAIEKHDYCDIAIAVASPKGLVVPVIRNCERLSFAQIELAVKDLATRARDGKLSLEEMQGGTFTITNGGIFGSLMSTPILNPPQSAILGMHAIKNRAVEDPERPGQIALRPMMYLALSYDHRIIDGADSVRFLVKIKESLEDPRRLMLDV
jgi:2-oxoglutarate dehydrogenase E2 component (dihydrolipoamide succinyltransferase)